MNFLLDTNVVSELRRSVVDPGVRTWADNSRPSQHFVSVVSILELEKGALRAERKDRAKGAVLRQWLEGGVLASFHGRILEVDLAVARRTALLHVPDPRPEGDALLGATALVHGLTVVTRNVRDFEPMGVPVLNPWES